jgi:hypothetical protein
MCQDGLSKYLIASPMLTQTAEEVTLTFLCHIVLLYGILQSTVTDQGLQFLSDIFKRLCKLLQLNKQHCCIPSRKQWVARENTQDYGGLFKMLL